LPATGGSATLSQVSCACVWRVAVNDRRSVVGFGFHSRGREKTKGESKPYRIVDTRSYGVDSNGLKLHKPQINYFEFDFILFSYLLQTK
jgi:hypothetical protein